MSLPQDSSKPAMMKKKYITIFAFSLLIGSVGYGQSQKERKADKAYDQLAYQNAIESYETLVKKGYSDEEIYKNLGDANYLNANYAEAANWYGKLFMKDNEPASADHMYRYAQSLKSSGEYEASNIWMERFEDAIDSDLRAKNYNENQDYLEKIERMSGRYTIENIPINSPESDFAPSLKDQELIFSTARDTGKTFRNIHEWTNRSFLNLYKATFNNGTFSNAERLPKSMNKKTHESTTAFTKDGKTVYFTRNNSEKGKFARDNEGVSRLKIYRATIEGDEWKDITELPFNGDEFSTAHPTLNPDETKLYFASDREGTYGASDIYVVDVNEDGSFGTPKNLGNSINTESRETFPFAAKNDILYFASDGHPGLGGLDIFAVQIKGDEISEIINLGKPLNGKQDDFSFFYSEESGSGFFASNRDGGVGSDDIYSFQEHEPITFECTSLINGIVLDQEKNLPLSNAKVLIVDKTEKIVTESITDRDGRFSANVDCNAKQLKVVASKEDYDSSEKSWVATQNSDEIVNVKLTKSLKAAPVGTNLITYLNLQPIYFDLDKDVIRTDAMQTLEKVIAYLNTFPNTRIEVQSHTDVRASESYNLNLSARRAKNTVAYLIANGVEENRLESKGYGESQLVNNCETSSSCADKRHEENRRSEFIVIK